MICFKFFLILNLMWVLNIWAQNLEEEKFIKYDLAKVFENINWSDPLRTPCPPKEPQVIKSEVICLDCVQEQLKVSDYNIFELNYEKPEDVPAEIRKIIPGDSFESTKGGLALIIALPNDNKLMGLWGMIFGYDKDGDDYGYSHGGSLQVKKTFKNDLTFSLEGATNLYTEKLEGYRIDLRRSKNGKLDFDWYFDQHFTNESLIKLAVDNIAKGKTNYYKAGVGWVSLDSKNWKGMEHASGQQFKWHAFGDFDNFNYVVDNNKFRQSINIEAFLGLQKNLINNNSSCRLKVYGEMGGSLTNNQVNASYFKGEAGGTFYFQKVDSKFSFMTGLSGQTLVHATGVQRSVAAKAGVKSKRTALELDLNQKYGKLQNHANYNVDNDSIMTIKLTFILGSIKK